MRTLSPPRTPKLVFFLGLLLLTYGIVHGQALELPDLVIIRDAEPDIPLPDQFPDLAATWNPTPLWHRRQYRIPVENYLNAPESLPDNLPVADPTVGIGTLELLGNVSFTKLGPLQPGTWSARLLSDIREGADLGIGRTFENIGEIRGAIFIPFLKTSARPWSGEIGWERSGLFSSAVRIGMKEGGILPYSAATLNWDRGINQPDSYFIGLHYFGYSPYRLSILGAVDLFFRLKKSDWSIITKIEGGVSHSVADTGISGRAAFAIGPNLPGYGLRSEIGVDMAYDYPSKIRVMPFLGLSWLVDDSISIYANAEILMRYPDNLGSLFFRERLISFEAQIPIQSKYRLGITQVEKKRVSYLFEISYAEGRFCGVENRIVVGRDDKRVRGLASIGYKFNNHRIDLSGKLDFSLLGYTNVWEGKIELTGERLSYYIFSGSQDAILGEFLGGSRGKEAIIGLGLDWRIHENWRASVSAYAGMPWNSPSLKLALAWKSNGAVDE